MQKAGEKVRIVSEKKANEEQKAREKVEKRLALEAEGKKPKGRKPKAKVESQAPEEETEAPARVARARKPSKKALYVPSDSEHDVTMAEGSDSDDSEEYGVL